MDATDTEWILVADQHHAGGADDVEIIGRVEGVGRLSRQLDFAIQSDFAGGEFKFAGTEQIGQSLSAPG